MKIQGRIETSSERISFMDEETLKKSITQHMACQIGMEVLKIVPISRTQENYWSDCLQVKFHAYSDETFRQIIETINTLSSQTHDPLTSNLLDNLKQLISK